MQNPQPLLMLPGPTPLPPEVLAALQQQPLNHRSPAWSELYFEVEAGLKWAYQTQNDILMLAGSGTTAMEAALVNTLSPGDRVLSLVNGSFGQRFGDMAEAFGMQVDRLSYAWGSLLSLEDLEQQLEQQTYQAVLIVHNETSTGVLNPLQAIAKRCQAHGALTLVDTISSLTTVPIPVDSWKLDVVLSASQKSFMCPPGMAFVSLSEKAWQANQQARCPRYTLDFQLAKTYALKGMNPWTPPISHYWALQAALKLMQAEGLKAIQKRHENYMHTVRSGAISLGLQPLIQAETYASRSVTPLLPPPGLSADLIRETLLQNHGITLGSGQRQLTGKLFRIGHLGYQDPVHIQQVLAALKQVLNTLKTP